MDSEPSYIKVSAKSGKLIQLIFFINDVYFHFHIVSTSPLFWGWGGVGSGGGVEPLTKFSKRKGACQDLNF